MLSPADVMPGNAPTVHHVTEQLTLLLLQLLPHVTRSLLRDQPHQPCHPSPVKLDDCSVGTCLPTHSVPVGSPSPRHLEPRTCDIAAQRASGGVPSCAETTNVAEERPTFTGHNHQRVILSYWVEACWARHGHASPQRLDRAQPSALHCLSPHPAVLLNPLQKCILFSSPRRFRESCQSCQAYFAGALIDGRQDRSPRQRVGVAPLVAQHACNSWLCLIPNSVPEHGIPVAMVQEVPFDTFEANKMRSCSAWWPCVPSTLHATSRPKGPEADHARLPGQILELRMHLGR
eukprot:3939050-Rhodomonas_salina.2